MCIGIRLQQALVMVAGLEKPRDDYIELILHVSCLGYHLLLPHSDTYQ